MKFINHIFVKHRSTALALIALFIFAVLLKVSAVSGGPFTPGETLNPDCYPSNVNCIVKIFPTDAAGALKNDGSGNLTWGTAGSAISGLTQNYLSKSNAAGDNIVNSIIFDDGTNVGIGTTNPQTKLSILGGVDDDLFTLGDNEGGTVIFNTHKILSSSANGLNINGLSLKQSGSIVSLAENDITGYNLASINIDTQLMSYGKDVLNILENGNVGIGTIAPDTALHVVGSIKMVDGNQGAGKVLTSDANGVGTWQPASGGSSVKTYKALISQNAPITIAGATTGPIYAGQHFTLTGGADDGSMLNGLTLLTGTWNAQGSTYLAPTDLTLTIIGGTLVYDGSPYVVSTNAAGGFAPFVNTENVVLSRPSDPGVFLITFDHPFVLKKTIITHFTPMIGGLILHIDNQTWNNPNNIMFETLDSSNTDIDGALYYTPIEIEVYP